MVTRAIRTLLPPPKGGWDKKFWCAMKFFASEANETNFRRKTSHVPFGWRSRESKYPDPTKGGESASFGGVVKMALTALGDAALVFRMTCNFPDSNRVSLGLANKLHCAWPIQDYVSSPYKRFTACFRAYPNEMAPIRISCRKCGVHAGHDCEVPSPMSRDLVESTASLSFSSCLPLMFSLRSAHTYRCLSAPTSANAHSPPRSSLARVTVLT